MFNYKGKIEPFGIDAIGDKEINFYFVYVYIIWPPYHTIFQYGLCISKKGKPGERVVLNSITTYYAA